MTTGYSSRLCGGKRIAATLGGGRDERVVPSSSSLHRPSRIVTNHGRLHHGAAIGRRSTTTTTTTQLGLSPDSIPPFVSPLVQGLHDSTPPVGSFLALFQLFASISIPSSLWKLMDKYGLLDVSVLAFFGLLWHEFHSSVVVVVLPASGSSSFSPVAWLLVFLGAGWARSVAFAWTRELLGIPKRLFYRPNHVAEGNNPLVRLLLGACFAAMFALYFHPLLAALQVAEECQSLAVVSTWQSALNCLAVALVGLSTLLSLGVNTQLLFTHFQFKEQAMVYRKDNCFAALHNNNDEYKTPQEEKKKDVQELFVQPTGGLYQVCRDPDGWAKLILWLGLSLAGLTSVTSLTGWILWNLRLFVIFLLQTRAFGTEDEEKYGGQARFEEYRARVKNRFPKPF